MNNDTAKTKDFSYQEDPIPGHAYTLTWDPAKRPDFSVITVVDRDTGRVAVFDHGNLSEYRSQVIRVLSLASKYNKASIVIDPTGIGSPLVEEIRALGVAVLEKVL
jgi:hypothetical protein